MSKELDFILSIADGVLLDAIEKKFLPSLTLAQACLESAYGKSELSAIYHNYFGIKGEGSAGKVTFQTTEYVNGVPQLQYANFAAYKSVQDGIAAHTNLFKNGVSWDAAKYHKLYSASDYKEAARIVQECGYATDPKYAEKLIKIIETYKLYEYDGKFWEALAPAKELQWKVDAMKWLSDIKNVNPPISDHSPDEPITFALLGAILSRIVRK